ncbi:MAG: hypothetical protein GY880_17035, partial [Planctomycetaceae bacterium]|nr:hypothetical protein [Planctomycetaceae bacterium]
ESRNHRIRELESTGKAHIIQRLLFANCGEGKAFFLHPFFASNGAMPPETGSGYQEESADNLS